MRNVRAGPGVMTCHELWSHVTHVTSLTNGQMTHVVTLHMCPCVDMSHVMCRYAGESLSLPSQARLHHTAPLEQHNHV